MDKFVTIALAVSFLLVSLLRSPVSAAFPLPSTGIVDPPSHYQRFRMKEYPAKKPFFQWWYTWVKSEDNGHYAFAYCVSDDNNGVSNGYYGEETGGSSTGAYGMFAHVTEGREVQMVKAVKLPLAALTIANDFDYSVESAGGTMLRLTDLGDGNARLEGKMSGTDALWYTTGADPNATVTWNITTKRVHGWYGQPEFEIPDHFKDVIMWNTWAHFSVPIGSVAIDDNVMDIDPSVFKAYLDMNWGTGFPAPPKKDPNDFKEYHWGWYVISTFDSQLTPEDQKAIVVGTGRTWAGFPLGEMKAQFGDIQLGRSCSMMSDPKLCGIQNVQGFVDTNSKIQQSFEKSTDGKVHTFKSTQGNWTTWKDSFGEALIPLTQEVLLETDHVSVKMEFTSTTSNYVRLLFPHKGTVFSDFEALGVSVTLTIANRTSPSEPFNPIWEKTLKGAGLEFGYHVPASQFNKWASGN